MTDTRRTSSGDLIADRRFYYAKAYSEAGDHQAAAELLAQALDLAPDWPEGWLALGEARMLAGDETGAAMAFGEALRLDPRDVAGAAPRLARLKGETPASLPEAHVRALFDDYAPRFDQSLLNGLQYRAPDHIAAALARHAPGRQFHSALDLGCGTGLMARALVGRCEAIDGVDLSRHMLVEAKKTGLYRNLDEGELLAHLRGLAAQGRDLILAADVLVYLGDPAPVFSEIVRVLQPGGLFGATFQEGAAGMALGEDFRFAHSAEFLALRLAETGLDTLAFDRVSARKDAGRDVPGLLVLARAG